MTRIGYRGGEYKKCLHCNSNFYITQSKQEQKYCSSKCHYECGRKEITCKTCDKIIKIKKSEKLQHCSVECEYISRKGKKKPESYIEKLKERMKGKENPMVGKKHTEEAKQKMRDWTLKNQPMHRPEVVSKFMGSNNSSWKGGISFEPYGIEFDNRLKEFIRKRDNYRCQECFRHQEELKRKLDVHHIDFDKKNNSPENLIALCQVCHCQTYFDRENWVDYYQGRMIQDGKLEVD